MPRIETYPFDLAPTVNDYVIGTDGDSLNATKNYKIMTFLDFLGTQYNLNSTDLLFEYDTVASTAVGTGYVSTNNYADGTILMSGVTNIYVSKITGFGQLVDNVLTALGTDTLSIMFADMGDRNNFGIFNVVSAADVDANTINLTVTATSTLGVIVDGKSMGIRVGIGASGADNLGNHIATETLQMGAFKVSQNIGQSIFFGDDAGRVDDETTNNNVGIGFRPLYNNVAGSQNVAIGGYAMYTANGATSNIAIGFQALRLNTTGGSNVGIGVDALRQITTGHSNVAIGNNVGDFDTTPAHETNAYGVLIGTLAEFSAEGTSREIAIGYNVHGKGSNTVNIGETTLDSFYFGFLKNDITGLSAERTATWQNTSGTVAWLTDIPTVPTISDTAYDATTWNGNTDGASKNAIRDKIETLSSANWAIANITPYTTTGATSEEASSLEVPIDTLTANGDILEFRFLFQSTGSFSAADADVQIVFASVSHNAGALSGVTGTVSYILKGSIQRITDTTFVIDFDYNHGAGGTTSLQVFADTVSSGAFSTTAYSLVVNMTDATNADNFTFRNGWIKYTPIG